MKKQELDFNLLKLALAVDETASLTEAAKRIHITQPAASNALKRLRDQLGDECFVRTKQGMKATPNLRALLGQAKNLQAAIEALQLDRDSFDPKKDTYRVSVVADDGICHTLFVPLMQHFLVSGYLTKLDIRRYGEGFDPSEISDDRVQLAISVRLYERASLYAAKLYEDRFVSMVSRDHPALSAKRGKRPKLTIDDYEEFPHILVAPFGGLRGRIDDTLERLKKSRTVQFSVPFFSVAPEILPGTQGILTLPERLAKRFATVMPLCICETPVEVPGFSYYMHWHQRHTQHPGHKWLREQIRLSVRSQK